MESTKAKIIHIAEILQGTDEFSPLTAVEIGRRLEQEYGIIAERKSICRDIRVLRDECNMDICRGYLDLFVTFAFWGGVVYNYYWYSFWNTTFKTSPNITFSNRTNYCCC